MSKRDWIKPVALVLATVFLLALFSVSWFAFSAYQDTHTIQREEVANYQAESTNSSVSTCNTIMAEGGLLDWLSCLMDYVSTDSDAKQSQYDLQAQQDMAAWAFGMLLVTVWLTVFTAFGVVFVWLTLKATREVGRDQSRAYLHAEKAYFFWGGEKQASPRVEVWVQNTGQTPAHWYEIRLKEFVYDPSEINDKLSIVDQVKLPDRFHGPWNGVPIGGDGRKSTFVFRDDADVREITKAAQDKYGLSNPSHGFSIVGEIRYKTFFGEIFVSQFAFGRAFLPAYQIEETRTREVDAMTINDHIEKPIPLARYAANLKTYERQS